LSSTVIAGLRSVLRPCGVVGLDLDQARMEKRTGECWHVARGDIGIVGICPSDAVDQRAVAGGRSTVRR
jgi:hypothetical protein